MGDGSHTPKFVRDMSKYWYKPHISREEGKLTVDDALLIKHFVNDSISTHVVDTRHFYAFHSFFILFCF